MYIFDSIVESKGRALRSSSLAMCNDMVVIKMYSIAIWFG